MNVDVTMILEEDDDGVGGELSGREREGKEEGQVVDGDET